MKELTEVFSRAYRENSWRLNDINYLRKNPNFQFLTGFWIVFSVVTYKYS